MRFWGFTVAPFLLSQGILAWNLLGSNQSASRRHVLQTSGSASFLLISSPALAQEENTIAATVPVEVAVSGDAKKVRFPFKMLAAYGQTWILTVVSQLFNEGRALESQGNMAAANRLYAKVTKISPRVSARGCDCFSRDFCKQILPDP